jgi:hypothetical protein
MSVQKRMVRTMAIYREKRSGGRTR